MEDKVHSLCVVYSLNHPVMAIPVVRVWQSLRESYDSHCVVVSNCACLDTELKQRCGRCDPAGAAMEKTLTQAGEREPSLVGRVPDEERRQLRETLQDLSIGEIENFEFQGVPVGRFALYLVITKYKTLDATSLNDEAVSVARNALYRCCEAILGVERWVAEKGMPEYCVVYDDLYGVNRSICEWVESRGCQRVAMLGSPCLSRIGDEFRFAIGSLFDLPKKQAVYWQGLSDEGKSLSPPAVGTVKEFFFELFAAKRVHVYSKPLRDHRPTWKQTLFSDPEPEGCRYVLAALGSEDERTATRVAGNLSSRSEDFLFQSQLEWVKHLIDHYSGREDVRLIVRVHPRDYPNKRESRKSEHAVQLEREIRDLPANVAANWPSDGISLYGLFPWMDLILGNSSTVPLEASGLGLPLIFPKFDGVSYQTVADWNPESEAEYAEALEAALERGPTLERALNTWRWYGMRYCHTVMRLASEALLRGESGMIGRLKAKVPGRLYWLPGYHLLGSLAFREAIRCGEVEGDRPDVMRRLLDGTVSSGQELEVIDDALAVARFASQSAEREAVMGALQELAKIICPPEHVTDVPPLVRWIREQSQGQD